MTDYSRALEYLYGLEQFGIVFGLENIEWILELLGNPHHDLKVVHVGGTNGKGSVTSMTARVLREAGYKVGRYTSPHLISFTERIAVNDREITQDEVVELTVYMKEKVVARDRDHFFTFFDFTTALAFEYFARQAVDVAVVEVGLGGRLDSTNVVHPLVSVITNVAFEHMEYLGDSLAAIAREKAGIIKRRVPVVSATTATARRIVEETADRYECPLYLWERDFSFRKAGERRMHYQGLRTELDNLSVNLRGDYQLTNGAVALATLECLQGQGFTISESSIREGLSRVVWDGRLEVVKESPLVILDAAHNPDGIETLVDYLEGHYGDRRKIVVFGVMKDKEHEKMAASLARMAQEFIATRPATDRARPAEDLKGVVPRAIVTGSVREALEKARQSAGDSDVVVVTGSFYTVGEAKTLIHEIF